MINLEERVQNFNKDLPELLAKHNLALGAVPFIRPDGSLGARPHLVDGDLIKQQKESQLESVE